MIVMSPQATVRVAEAIMFSLCPVVPMVCANIRIFRFLRTLNVFR